MSCLPRAGSLSIWDWTTTSCRCVARSCLTCLQCLARAHDEPFADPASVPLYLLARALAGRDQGGTAG